MTDIHTSLTVATISAEWEVKQRDYARLMKALHPENKTALFDALATAGITHVLVTFNGEGDSGQIEDIAAKDADVTVALPPNRIEIASAVWGQAEPDRTFLSLSDAIEQIAYDLLGETYYGWENNDGAYGEFSFDVAVRTITLDFNARHMESDYSQRVF